jgi:hypothetical protein
MEEREWRVSGSSRLSARNASVASSEPRDYYIVKRSFRRDHYPLPKRQAEVEPERRRVLMRTPRKVLFEAPRVRRKGELDPATDGYYSG